MAQQQTQLSRELLRWIQSLDLAYSIKNPKRDFANGFLIAEILSRYFDQAIQMHSYDNGTGIPIRKDNWEQLQKFFTKQRITEIITRDDVDKIVHCENGAAVTFLNNLYEFLTKRKVQEPVAPPMDDNVPAFARPTASQVMHDAMKTSNMQENADRDTQEGNLKESMSSHLDNLQQERSADPDRFNAVNKQPSKILRGPTRTVGNDEPSMAEIQVKEVKINQISDRNVAQLRANKEGAGSRAAMNSISGSRSVLGGNAVDPIQCLDDCVRSVLTNHPIMDVLASTDAPLIDAFVSNVISRGIEVVPDPLAAEVFQAASEHSENLACACLSSPPQYYRVSAIYLKVLMDCEEASETFARATQGLVEIGKKMVELDNSTTTNSFEDYTLKPLGELLRSPGKRHAILRILYSFCPQDVDSHIAMIKKLQSNVKDMNTFVHALTILIFMERQMNDSLLDLYLYYSIIGITEKEPGLRAASIAMLSVVVAHNASAVTESMPHLVILAKEDTWWEVHAQLLVVCSALLRQLNPDSPDTAAVFEIINAVFSDKSSDNIKKIGLSYLAKNVESHKALLPGYLRVLLSLPRDDASKTFVVSTNPSHAQELAVAGASGGKYRLAPLPLSPGWSGLKIAQQLVQDVQDQQPEHMEVEQMQALLACLTTSPDKETVFASNQDCWAAVFNHARDYVFVALCDAECCDLALCILREFVLRSSLQEKVLQEGTLLGSLRLLYPMEGGADEGCQTKVAEFLEEMYKAGSPYSGAIGQLLDQFAHNHPAQFEASPLQPLRAQIQ